MHPSTQECRGRAPRHGFFGRHATGSGSTRQLLLELELNDLAWADGAWPRREELHAAARVRERSLHERGGDRHGHPGAALRTVGDVDGPRILLELAEHLGCA